MGNKPFGKNKVIPLLIFGIILGFVFFILLWFFLFNVCCFGCNPPNPNLVIANQRAMCGTNAIYLPDYSDFFPESALDASKKLTVSHMGTNLSEPVNGKFCLVNEPVEAEYSCQIGNPEGNLIKLEVTEDKCVFSDA
jgi:hypothetical protein